MSDLVQFIFNTGTLVFQSPILMGFFVMIAIMLFAWINKLPLSITLALAVILTYFLQLVNAIFFPIYILSLIMVGVLVALAVWQIISS